jgi:hypothetical protein
MTAVGVIDQAVALDHNHDPANLSAVATWRNCFGYVASAERYQDPLRDP